MEIDEACAQLDYHSNPSEPGMVPSFVGSLRPYSGLREDAYEDVMSCLRVVAPLLQTADVFPRGLMSSLFTLTWWPRYWGLAEDGMLRRNDLITEADQRTLEGWVDHIANAVHILLAGGSVDDAFERPRAVG